MYNPENKIIPEASRIDIIRHELMQIERQVMDLKIHYKADSETEISRLHLRQSELLAELQQLENEK